MRRTPLTGKTPKKTPAVRKAPARAAKVTAVYHTVTTEQIAVEAYYIAERRRRLHLPGDAQSDWLEAERRLRS